MNNIKEIAFSDLDLLKIGNTIAMSGSIWSGEGKTLICLFPDQELEKEVAILKMNLEEWKKLIRQSDLLETAILQQGPDGVIKAVIRKSQRLIDQRVMWQVYERDGYHCRYCGKGGVPLTVDHVILWEEGGPTIEGNLLTACRKCNKHRGNMPYQDWLESERYKKVSQNLNDVMKQKNLALVDKLPEIETVKHIRSR